MQYILIVEDEIKIARIVKAYLESDGYKVILADTGKKAVEVIEKELPLLVILDLMLPDISGEEVCQYIKELGDIPVIMLTAKTSEEEKVVGFRLGADDYVTKPFSPRELVARVRAVLKRTYRKEKVFTEPMSFNNGRLVIDAMRHELKKDGISIKVTPTEFKILLLLAKAPGRVFNRTELIEQALGYQFEGYDRSIDAHIKNLRQKIEDDPKNPTHIQTVYGVGYRFDGKMDK
ncbi:MAG: response regulator transcription factor [Nitrospirota bacterium]